MRSHISGALRHTVAVVAVAMRAALVCVCARSHMCAAAAATAGTCAAVMVSVAPQPAVAGAPLSSAAWDALQSRTLQRQLSCRSIVAACRRRARAPGRRCACGCRRHRRTRVGRRHNYVRGVSWCACHWCARWGAAPSALQCPSAPAPPQTRMRVGRHSTIVPSSLRAGMPMV